MKFFKLAQKKKSKSIFISRVNWFVRGELIKFKWL